MLHGSAEDRIPGRAHRPRHRKPDALAILPVGDAAGRSYAELYVEHAPAARGVALSMVPRDVADDIVAEAFTRVLGAIRAGGGPGLAFRAYLLAAVRNTASDWLRASRRTTVVGDVEHDLDNRVPEENLGLARLSRGPEAEAEARAEARLVARAFAKLPARWRAVLWQLEVEARAPAAVAPIFGLSANGVSALAVRAREGLRQAYLAEHVGANIPAACRSYAEALSAGARGRLSRRRAAAVHDHLAQCASCHSLAGELIELNSRLGAILTPAALAGTSAAMSEGGRGLLHLGGLKAGAGAKGGAGAKAALGAKAGLGAKVVLGARGGGRALLGGHWRLWKLHPLTAAASTTAGIAAAGGMVVAVGVSPWSPFRAPHVSERPAAASSVSLSPALPAARSVRHLPIPSAAPVGAASSALAGGLPLAGGPVSQAAGAPDGATGGTAATPSTGPVGSLVKGAGSVVGDVGTTVTGLGQTVTGLGDAAGRLVQGAGGTAGGLTGGVGGAVEGVTGGVGGLTRGVGGALRGK